MEKRCEGRRTALGTCVKVAKTVAGRLATWYRVRQLQQNLSPLPCERGGIPQNSGTCWFNSALNGLLLGPLSSGLMLRELQRLTPSQRARLREVQRSGVAACPRMPTKLLILAHADAVLVPGQTELPETVLLPSLRMKVSPDDKKYGNRWSPPNRTVNLMTRMQIGVLNADANSNYAQLPRVLLDKFLTQGEYRVVQLPYHIVRGIPADAPFDSFVTTADMQRQMLVFKTKHSRSGFPYMHKANNVVPPVLPRSVGFGYFVLDHAILEVFPPEGLKDKKGELETGHAMVGFICRGEDYVYDSNISIAFRCNWSKGDVSQVIRWARRAYPEMQATNVVIRYAVYVNSSAVRRQPSPPPARPKKPQPAPKKKLGPRQKSMKRRQKR